MMALCVLIAEVWLGLQGAAIVQASISTLETVSLYQFLNLNQLKL